MDNISKLEFIQVNEAVPVAASPDIDWYIKTPQSSFLPLPFPVHLRLESLIVAEFLPSTTTTWALEAVPVVFVTDIDPVE